MALQANGTISLTEVATEFGGTAPHQMSEYFGVDIGVPASGSAIGLGNFYSKANKFVATITSNAQQLNLYTWLTSIGWDQNRKVELTINSGVYIWSDSTAVAALNMGGTYPKGLTIINNGYIIGKGGNGGSTALIAGAPAYTVTPTPGGMAINLTGPATIDNTNGYIGGGGGGGAASCTSGLGIYVSIINSPGGGGAGGGLAGVFTSDSAAGGPATSTSPTPPGPGGLGSSVLSYRNPVNATYGVPTLGVSGGAGGSGGVSYYTTIGGSI
jgi:hypothetical protein